MAKTIKLVQKSKLDKANESIERLIDDVVELEKDMMQNYCCYTDPKEREEKCGDSCWECKYQFYKARKKEMLEQYCVR